eukprot:scaffold1195_cov358-Prasinococcus_capsulatus_cf.AAC.3
MAAMYNPKFFLNDMKIYTARTTDAARRELLVATGVRRSFSLRALLGKPRHPLHFELLIRHVAHILHLQQLLHRGPPRPSRGDDLEDDVDTQQHEELPRNSSWVRQLQLLHRAPERDGACNSHDAPP